MKLSYALFMSLCQVTAVLAGYCANGCAGTCMIADPNDKTGKGDYCRTYQGDKPYDFPCGTGMWSATGGSGHSYCGGIAGRTCTAYDTKQTYCPTVDYGGR